MEAFWLINNYTNSEDFVVGTGRSVSVKHFVEIAFRQVGIDIQWIRNHSCFYAQVKPSVEKKVGLIPPEKIVVIVDQSLVRNERYKITADNSKITKVLGWQPQITLEKMLSEMLSHELSNYKINFY